jgi:hypothetical protein
MFVARLMAGVRIAHREAGLSNAVTAIDRGPWYGFTSIGIAKESRLQRVNITSGCSFFQLVNEQNERRQAAHELVLLKT